MNVDPHKHGWEPVEKIVRVHNYRQNKGKMEAVDMVARDTLKQYKCKCGKVETYDMERKKIL